MDFATGIFLLYFEDMQVSGGNPGEVLPVRLPVHARHRAYAFEQNWINGFSSQPLGRSSGETSIGSNGARAAPESAICSSIIKQWSAPSPIASPPSSRRNSG